jgi:hypothetical protein
VSILGQYWMGWDGCWFIILLKFVSSIWLLQYLWWTNEWTTNCQKRQRFSPSSQDKKQKNSCPCGLDIGIAEGGARTHDLEVDLFAVIRATRSTNWATPARVIDEVKPVCQDYEDYNWVALGFLDENKLTELPLQGIDCRGSGLGCEQNKIGIKTRFSPILSKWSRNSGVGLCIDHLRSLISRFSLWHSDCVLP